MTFDYSKLSDNDLEALAKEDYSSISDEGLKHLTQSSAPEQTATSPQTQITALPEVANQTAITAIKPLIGGPGENVMRSPELRAAQQELFPGNKFAAQEGKMGLIPKTVGGAYNVAKDILSKGNLGDVLKFAEHPYINTVESVKGLAKPILNTTPMQGLKSLGGAVGGALVQPENLFALPYQGAAYEQEKIRANPSAPEYANNPYAMQQRGVAPTQGSAGAMNQRAAVAGQQYGGLSQQEQAMLEQDKINRMIRLAAAKKALGPIAPGQ